MKKIFVFLLFSSLFCNSTLAESYFFKECKLSNAVLGSYIIDLKNNVIQVNLKSIDGKTQNFSDKIKSVEQDKIISEKIKSAKGDKIYYQYFLDSKSRKVIKLQYKKQSGIDMDLFKITEKRESQCSNVKADWDKKKIDEAKIDDEQKEILKAQEKIKKEQKKLINCQNSDYKLWNNCKGTYKSASGHKYIGIFFKGSIAKGTSTYPDGAKYVGEFKNFKPNGYGTFVWTNGDKYYGEWKDGKSHGDGTKRWKDGREYLGEFENDKLHGEGTLFYPDGSKYVGEFIDGKRHGEGTFSYADGTAYIGKFLAGQEEGLGECVAKDGSSKPCKSQTETQTQDFSGKNTKNISIVAKKWVRISQYETNTKKGKKIMDKLKMDFEIKAQELCAANGKYKVLQKRIEILDLDETPAYGLETKLQIGINGVVECI